MVFKILNIQIFEPSNFEQSNLPRSKGEIAFYYSSGKNALQAL